MGRRQQDPDYSRPSRRELWLLNAVVESLARTRPGFEGPAAEQWEKTRDDLSATFKAEHSWFNDTWFYNATEEATR